MRAAFFCRIIFFSTCTLSFAQNSRQVEDDKAFQACLSENDASSCTSGCGLIIQHCIEKKDGYTNKHDKKSANSTSGSVHQRSETNDKPVAHKLKIENNQLIFHHPTLGMCRNSRADILAEIHSRSSGNSIENSFTLREVTSQIAWVVSSDEGSKRRWHLIERINGKYCNTLYIPFADDANIMKIEGIPTIASSAQKNIDGAQYVMTFRRSKPQGIYIPYKCSKTDFSHDSKTTATRSIDCGSIEIQ